jgi:hypothetical protein
VGLFFVKVFKDGVLGMLQFKRARTQIFASSFLMCILSFEEKNTSIRFKVTVFH